MEGASEQLLSVPVSVAVGVGQQRPVFFVAVAVLTAGAMAALLAPLSGVQAGLDVVLLLLLYCALCLPIQQEYRSGSTEGENFTLF